MTLSVAFGCPFEGEVDPAHVLESPSRAVARRRPDALVLADTIGVAAPSAVRSLVTTVAELGVPVGGHFHNTRNTGYANALAALEAGAAVLDASVGGLGGCPFAPNATGNIATEDLVYALEREGVDDGRRPRGADRRRRVDRGRARTAPRRSALPRRLVSRPSARGTIVPRTSPSSSSPARPRSTTSSPSSRNVALRAVGESQRPLAVPGQLDERSLAIPGSGPEIVPDANRSPVRIDAPFTVACASCCGIVQ